MIRPLAAALTLALFALPVAAQDNVATAAAVNGSVQVNQGSEFVPLAPGQTLNAGDRVMAGPNSSARIRFADGCDLTVAPETMVTVPATSNCAGGVVATQATAPVNTGAVGGAEYAGGVDWAGAGIVTAVAVIGNVILFNEDDDDTSSP